MSAARMAPPLKPALVLAAVALGLGACAPHQIYRPDLTPCASAKPAKECRTSAVQEYRDPGNGDGGYLLGFIEFDDQGQLWSRPQMRAVLDAIGALTRTDDVLMVVFVHGWKHSAAPGDDNIVKFREVLQRVSALESQFATQSGLAARKIAGIYLGWRGGSLTASILKELTFWDRKATAQKVGHGAVTEVLAQLEFVKKTREAILRQSATANGAKDPGRAQNRTRLVVIGHSFGGAVVYTAVGQLLEDRFVLTDLSDAAAVGTARGFGDLVVLINPAFEANLYAPLSDMTTERGNYFRAQRPVLAVLTSEADDATGIAFPIGRWFSTVIEIERPVMRRNPVTHRDETIDQHTGNVTAVGHFMAYRTHYLQAVDMPMGRMRPTMQQEMTMFDSVRKQWECDKPGHIIHFHGSTLTRTANSAGRNPYLMVQVDEALIPGHNEIYDERVMTFLRQLIFMSIGDSGKAERVPACK